MICLGCEESIFFHRVMGVKETGHAECFGMSMLVLVTRRFRSLQAQHVEFATAFVL